MNISSRGIAFFCRCSFLLPRNSARPAATPVMTPEICRMTCWTVSVVSSARLSVRVTQLVGSYNLLANPISDLVCRRADSFRILAGGRAQDGKIIQNPPHFRRRFGQQDLCVANHRKQAL
jgi:hypothetical protein